MRFYACIACQTSFQVAGPIEEVEHLWSVVESGGTPSCPTPLCQGKLMPVVKHHVRGFTKKEIPLHTFFRGINGFGSPNGEAASLKKFKELILSGDIVEAHAEPVGQPERVILKRLIMKDGTRLHFDSSARGACCYYIEQPGPSCLEVVDNELTNVDDAEADSGCGDSDREETGRDLEVEDSPAGRGPVSDVAASELPRTEPVPTVSAAGEVPAVAGVGDERGGGRTH